MPVVAVKSEQKCKLCSHEQRPHIDAILERRATAGVDEDGQTMNLEYVYARLRELGVENPTKENVRVHWSKHCEVVTGAELAIREKHHLEVLEAFSRGDRVSDDDGLELMKLAWYHEVRRKMEAGEKVGVTHDHFLKAVAERTKRKADEAAGELTRMLVGAIGKNARAEEIELDEAEYAELEE